MFKPHITLALIATLCYAVNGVITDRMLSRNHALWIQMITNGIIPFISFIAIICMHAAKRPPELHTEASSALVLSLVCGIILFAANYAFYQAFREGGTLPEITTILCLLPVFSYAFGLIVTKHAERPPMTYFQATHVLVGTSLILSGILVLMCNAAPKK